VEAELTSRPLSGREANDLLNSPEKLAQASIDANDGMKFLVLRGLANVVRAN
jgi:hypothetical protein